MKIDIFLWRKLILFKIVHNYTVENYIVDLIFKTPKKWKIYDL